MATGQVVDLQRLYLVVCRSLVLVIIIIIIDDIKNFAILKNGIVIEGQKSTQTS